MTNTEKLNAWIARNMPEMVDELACRHPGLYRARLNALTGENVRSCDTIEDGAARHLAALQGLTGQQ